MHLVQSLLTRMMKRGTPLKSALRPKSSNDSRSKDKDFSPTPRGTKAIWVSNAISLILVKQLNSYILLACTCACNCSYSQASQIYQIMLEILDVIPSYRGACVQMQQLVEVHSQKQDVEVASYSQTLPVVHIHQTQTQTQTTIVFQLIEFAVMTLHNIYHYVNQDVAKISSSLFLTIILIKNIHLSVAGQILYILFLAIMRDKGICCVK